MAEEFSKKLVLENAFREFSKFGNTNKDGKHISLSNIDKWLKQAGIIDSKKVSTTDTAIIFQRFKSKTIDFEHFLQFLDLLAQESKLDIETVKGKLVNCAAPGTSNATRADKSDIVSRMTDTSKYTGSHKERFDKKGKGKGKSGREDTVENTGYVQGYKHKGTYNKK